MDHRGQVEKAVEILRKGGLVAFATETVYGLGADATNPSAIQKIFIAKGRPSTNPLIVHVADQAIARKWVSHWPDSAGRLADEFWPGPLTFVLPKNPQIVPAVTAGLPNVGIRSPDHPLALELLQKFAGPVAAPSANRSNRVSPTNADHVRQELGDEVDLILDGGPCAVGIESTVIDLASPRPAILRPGAISRAQIEAIIGPVNFQENFVSVDSSPSPGRQPIHYAPSAPAFRFSESDIDKIQKLFPDRLGGTMVFLIIGPSELEKKLRESFDPIAVVQMPGSAADYARQLYRALRQADEIGPRAICIQEPPAGEMWDAVRDRIHRATRPIQTLSEND